MRRMVWVLFCVALVSGACSGDDEATPTTTTRATPDGPQFCDAYLDYLSDSSPEQLAIVVTAAADADVDTYAAIIGDSGSATDALLAATADLDDLARLRCQPAWTAGAQGAGNTGAAAQALLDALVAGDRVGAANVASANALAVFEPWAPLSAAGETDAFTVAEVGETVFSLALGDVVAICQVETGVIIACQQS